MSDDLKHEGGADFSDDGTRMSVHPPWCTDMPSFRCGWWVCSECERWRPWCVGHGDCSLCDDCCDGDDHVEAYLGPEPSVRP